MEKLIYSTDIILHELPKGAIFGVGQLYKFKRFVNLCLEVYIPTQFIVFSAALNDFNRLIDFSNYIDIDKIIGISALKAFKNHLWYLVEELVPLLLFSNEVSINDKLIIVKTLKSFEKKEKFQSRYRTGFGRPAFPSAILDQSLIGHD